MPELPDIEVYLDALRERIEGHELLGVRLGSPFLLRSVNPPVADAAGRRVTGLRRLGKRIVFELEGDLYLVLHLMIAGRLRWNDPGAKLPGKLGLAAFDFEPGSLIVTEASKKKRASLHVVRGESGLDEHDPGWYRSADFKRRGICRGVTRENPYAEARPDRSTHLERRRQRVLGRDSARGETVAVQTHRQDRRGGNGTSAAGHRPGHGTIGWSGCGKNVGTEFPVKVTAFREEMAVHGRYGEPCPVCASPVQRLVYAANEANYCATCPDGRQVTGRSRSFAAAQEGLAKEPGRARATEKSATLRTDLKEQIAGHHDGCRHDPGAHPNPPSSDRCRSGPRR